MRLLVTRPIEDAEPLGERLQELGHTIVLAPVLEIRFLPGVPIPLDGVQAILATSANGVRAFASACEERSLPLFAVGSATAQTARNAGFAQVEEAGGNAAALADLTAARLDPSSGALLHAAGNVVKDVLQTRLEAAGFKVRRVVLYRADPVSSLDSMAEQALSSGGLDGVILHSPRSARQFVHLAQQARLGSACAELFAFCLSNEVAEAIAELTWRDIRIAGGTDLESMLALLPREPTVADSGLIGGGHSA